MKSTRDVSRPHLVPRKNFHTTRSSSTFKASSAEYPHVGRKKIRDQFFIRSSEETCFYSEEPVRVLSPRPVPDSRTKTPEPLPGPDSKRQPRKMTPKSDSRTRTSGIDSKNLNQEASVEELNEVDSILPGHSRTKNNIGGASDPQVSISPSIAAKELPTLPKGFEPTFTAMNPHTAGISSSHSHDSIKDLIQSMPDSPTSEDVHAYLEFNTESNSSKVSHTKVSQPSMNNSRNRVLPLSGVFHATSTSHVTETATEPQIRTLDGYCMPYPICFAYTSIYRPDSDHNTESKENKSDNSSKHKSGSVAPELPDKSGKSGKSGNSKATDPPGVPTDSNTPGVPVDATGLASEPATPASNLTPKQKMRVGGRKAIRTLRRIILRKFILAIMLGRRLADPTYDLLKLIAKGGSRAADAIEALGTLGAATSAALTRPPVPGDSKSVSASDKAATAIGEVISAPGEAVPAGDEALSANKEAVPASDEVVSTDDEAMKGGDEAASASGEVIPTDNVALSAPAEAVPAHAENISTGNGDAPAHDEAVQARDEGSNL